MFLSINCLGDSFATTATPPKKEYDVIKFYGESYLDNIHSQKKEMSLAELELMTNQQTYDQHTIFLADFDNENLEAGNIANAGMEITHLRIYRKKKGDILFERLGEIEAFGLNQSEYIDCTPQNNVEYEYQVKTISNGIEGDGMVGTGQVDFYGWILSDIDSDIIYRFDVEIESSDIQVLRDIHKYDNYTEKPAFSFGKKKYKEGSLTTMPLTYNEDFKEYETTLDTLDSLENFINDSKVKVLRNTKGEIFYVVTYDFKYKYMDRFEKQPYTISFSFSETDPNNN